MLEYTIVFLVLLAVSFGLYLLYERFFNKPSRSESSLYVEALKDLLDGDEIKAFGKLRQVITEDSDNIDAYLRLGQILRNAGKPDRALQVHKDLTLRTGLSADVKVLILRQLAEDYYETSDFDMAHAALKELITVDSGDLSARIRLLDIQERAHKWDEAYDTAVQILKLRADKSKKTLAVYKYQMGHELYQKREYHKARVFLKEAIGLDPQYVPAYLTIGDSYRDEERLEDAVGFWKKLITAIPAEGHQAIERLKHALFDLGRYGELSDVCENILEYDSHNLHARLTLAEFHEKKGDVDTAQRMLLQIVEESPEHLGSLMTLVRIYLDSGDRKKIEELFRMVERKIDNKQPSSVDKAVSTQVGTS